jgi:hypothetical protein
MNAHTRGFATVKTGHWLYAGTTLCAVRILRSDVWPGSGDLEDEPVIAEDREVECFHLEFYTPTGAPEWIGGGIYATVDDATRAAASKLGDSLQWVA